MSDLVTQDEISTLMKKVPEWELEGDLISYNIEFDDFAESIDFVNAVAEIAEEAEHHPDIDIRWCNVTLRLTTHEQGGLTEADFQLAQRIDHLMD